jgi:hypothetical protein
MFFLIFFINHTTSPSPARHSQIALSAMSIIVSNSSNVLSSVVFNVVAIAFNVGRYVFNQVMVVVVLVVAN